ncbi:MAG: glutaredoxin domain-containing protein [Candidatus Saccharimonadales bacterium]|nr:glutaredoxin domain-containing protein [Candidatus Saccharimonadales bacterium]
MSQKVSVTMYTNPTCSFCRMAGGYLKLNGIQFETKDISEDSEAYQEVIDKSGQLGVPVIDFDGTIILGFDRPKIDAVIREKGMK